MSTGEEKRKKRKYEKKLSLARLFFGLLMFLFALFLVISCIDMVRNNSLEEMAEPSEKEKTEGSERPEKPEKPDGKKEKDGKEASDQGGQEPGIILTKDQIALEETDIYSFLQGPLAWETKTDWGGAWCSMILKNQYFGAFGCGLCDLANIYSTLTPCECSPIDMYEYAQEVSAYTPVSGLGAIDWPELRDTLASVGIASELHVKDEAYEDFQEAMKRGITAIVLVSSENDTTYWQNVSGHYVNLWLYDPETDTAFLADSGNYGHTRERIMLRPVYDALKTSGSYQYLLVTSVDKDGNTWQHDGIDIEWVRPAYLQ